MKTRYMTPSELKAKYEKMGYKVRVYRTEEGEERVAIILAKAKKNAPDKARSYLYGGKYIHVATSVPTSKRAYKFSAVKYAQKR